MSQEIEKKEEKKEEEKKEEAQKEEKKEEEESPAYRRGLETTEPRSPNYLFSMGLLSFFLFFFFSSSRNISKSNMIQSLNLKSIFIFQLTPQLRP